MRATCATHTVLFNNIQCRLDTHVLRLFHSLFVSPILRSPHGHTFCGQAADYPCSLFTPLLPTFPCLCSLVRQETWLPCLVNLHFKLCHTSRSLYALCLLEHMWQIRSDHMVIVAHMSGEHSHLPPCWFQQDFYLSRRGEINVNGTG